MMLNYIHWDPKPEIFTIGDWGPRWYGVLFALGFVFGYYILLRVFKNEGEKQELLDSLTVNMFLGTLIGARLGHCLFYEPAYYLSNPLQILFVWKGGLASHGAGIGIVISLLYFSHKHKKPFLWVFDRITMVTALAGVCIRLGNLVNSEIVGKPTDLPWGFVFERLGEDFARHPSQLYEAIGYLIIFAILYFVFTKTNGGKKLGMISGLFLVLIFGYRFIIEFTKEVQVDFEQGMSLIMGQLLSIPFVIGGLILIYFANKRKLDTEK